MSGNSYTLFNALVDIIASPGKAFDEVKAHTSWWIWPYLISTLIAAGMYYYYYGWVDFSWLVEETIRQQPAEIRAEAAEGIRAFMQPGRSMWITVAAIPIVSLIIYLILAIYFHLANKLTTAAQIGFGQWFSFSVWANFVAVFASIASLILILMSDSNQVSVESLQVTSLNALLVHASPGDPWFRWASTLSLLNIWVWLLMIIGYSRWTGASTLKSSIIVLLPWAIIFGIWAVIII
ncbi:MAG: YIP1 family protein [Proteobacteria bacterium]|nr:YIP1 family protein [Pseudomonadota bacterium]